MLMLSSVSPDSTASAAAVAAVVAELTSGKMHCLKVTMIEDIGETFERGVVAESVVGDADAAADAAAVNEVENDCSFVVFAGRLNLVLVSPFLCLLMHSMSHFKAFKPLTMQSRRTRPSFLSDSTAAATAATEAATETAVAEGMLKVLNKDAGKKDAETTDGDTTAKQVVDVADAAADAAEDEIEKDGWSFSASSSS